MNIIDHLYSNKTLQKLLGTLPYRLKYALSDCSSVLDIGCGPSSPLKWCTNIDYSVGVEAYPPYVAKSKAEKIHSEYYEVQIQELSLANKSFDAVILIDVIEHLEETEALALIFKAEQWARKKVIISSPNGFVEQDSLDGNVLQKHLSGWDASKMATLGYSLYGMAGPKFLRKEVDGGVMDGGGLLSSIRYKPKMLWFIVAVLCQPVFAQLPKYAYSIFSVKRLDNV